MMQNEMMPMMWGMSLIHVGALVVVGLVIAALIKYLFFSGR